MICKNCNREIPNDSEYCSFCGSVVQSVVSADTSSDLSKGYTYLELKQWKDAVQFFKDAIINGDNKAEAYIGKMLAKFKTDSIESLVSSGKKFSRDDDFKLAIKYADSEYSNYLKECALKSNSKTKKIKIIISSICACIAVIALLTYFVFIPLNRISNYKNLLADGKAQKAVQSYTNSKWFEYDSKAKDLFYENGLKFVESKDYKNAEICFEITNDYTDNEKYLNYCKAQNLLADNDLESYNYFTDLGDFLDSKEILNTNEYFVMVNKLQGEWYSSGLSVEEKKNRLRKSGDYYEIDGIFVSKESYKKSYQDLLEEKKAAEKRGEVFITSGMLVGINGIDPETIEIKGIEKLSVIDDNKLGYEGRLVVFVDDTHIKIGYIEYTKQS